MTVASLFPAHTEARESGGIDSFTDWSLEELMGITVTSVSKREEDLFDAAAAVFVLTNEDIRRSGVTNIADSLRMVPGMNVGSAGSNHWAVSSRGFNSILANKLLVLVDGRAVYSPFFAGVYWDLQQFLLDDVDRVEVIRGPGATLWGANAVNGVVNIVTRSAKETQGTLLYGGGGDVNRALAGIRHGGQSGRDTYYRIFSTYSAKDSYPLADGRSAEDSWQAWHGGVRVDHDPAGETHAMWQANATVLDLDDGDSDAFNVHTLGRWSREFLTDSSIETQAYYDRTRRDEARDRLFNEIETVDLSFQNNLHLGERNELIWGLGYRFSKSEIRDTSPTVQVREENFDQNIFSTFLQNEFQVVPDRFSATAGVKVEHNDFTGFEFQPSVRMAFEPAERQTLWAAVSRAVRTPSEVEGRDAVLVPIGPPESGPGGNPVLPVVVSDGDLSAEILWAYEVGYRVQPTRRVSLDFAAFYNVYRDIIRPGEMDRVEPGNPMLAVFPWENSMRGNTYGGEAFGEFRLTERLRFSTAYSLLFAQLEESADMETERVEESSPRHQVTLRSAFDLSRRTEIDGQFRFVDAIFDTPSYVTADLRVAYRPTDHFELALVGQNLLQSRHREQPEQFMAVEAEVPRGFYGKLTWRF